jgi:exportin-1
VFDFSRGEMTQAKIKELKNSLNAEFAAIHELCMFALERSAKPDLIRATLDTLHAFLSWVPLGYIFESSLVEILLKLFPQPAYRNVAVQCLTEVGALSVGNFYDAQFVKLYTIFVSQLAQVLPRGTNIPAAYANGSDDEQRFVSNLALFFTGFFKAHIGLLEASPEGQQALLVGLEYLLGISYVEEMEVFKVCLDYWNVLVCDLFQSECALGDPAAAAAAAAAGSAFSFGVPPAAGAPAPGAAAPRKALYAAPMSKLRMLMIARMAKPEEVIVVEDENGNIVRETMKDNDVLAQYKLMRETLIYLSHLDHDDTEHLMLDKLANQLNGKEYAWATLNTLCWAVGSISGSMAEDQENKFLVTVIRDLLNLCEITRGKDHKAVIASNIMYVVGQYPRFLRAHWKFLKTVVNKLFEFMHETHPGVQDMACDTFLKISTKCKRKFVIQQVGESEPFVVELLRGLADTIKLLEPHQIHSFYESVGHMISAETDPQRRDEYLLRLMEPPNATWRAIIAQATANPEILKSPECVRNVANILQTNVSACTSVGQPFATQIALIYTEMLHVYRLYSEFMSALIAEGGPYASRSSQVKLLRSVKREVLRLVETFVDKCEDAALVAQQLVPAMLDPVLGDYARNVPDARDAEVLSLFAAIVNKLGGALMDEVPRIFEAVFECTLQMITRDFESYPEHRLRFFSFLRAVATRCFRALFALPPAHLQLVMDSIVWAFRHTERNVAETGLALLLDLLHSFSQSEHCNAFFASYFLSLTQEVFAVMTDSFHKPGFKMHAMILQHLFSVVDGDGPVTVSVPLWDAAALGPAAYPSNAAFVRAHVTQLLSTSFPNMGPAAVAAAVAGMFETKKDFTAFKNHMRDFLVQTKSFSVGDNRDLYAEETAAAELSRRAAIPGMLAPHEVADDGMADS